MNVTWNRCPIPRAHKRLADAHHKWHQALYAYEDPELFRINLNTAIESFRGLTWILQSEKAKIPGFATWYEGPGGWQERMKADRIMRWIVEKRNLITKQRDLESESKVKVTVHMDWLHSQEFTKTVPPLLSTKKIAEMVRIDGIPKTRIESTLVQIERMWIVEGMENMEVLDALGYAFGFLTTIINDAHRQCAVAECEPGDSETEGCMGGLKSLSQDGRPTCMIATEELRSCWVSFATGEVLSPQLRDVDLSPRKLMQAASRYSVNIDNVRTDPQSAKSLAGRTEEVFELAKKVTEKDGTHVFTAIIESKSMGCSYILGIQPELRSDKMLFMQKVAYIVDRLRADTVFCIGEAWTATVNMKDPITPAAESENRTEVLQVCCENCDGESISLFGEMKRSGSILEVGKATTMEGRLQNNSFEPIRRVWRRLKTGVAQQL